MKKVINGFIYDSNVGHTVFGAKDSSINDWKYDYLVITKNGNWYLHTISNPDKEDIIPMSEDEAFSFLVKNNASMALIKYFKDRLMEA